MGWTITVHVNNSPPFVNKLSNALAHNGLRRRDHPGKDDETPKMWRLSLRGRVFCLG
jgi:hypothetical protein